MQVLIKPLITEKMTQLFEQGQYGFEVDRRATKTDIKRAIEQQYPEVKVDKVRTWIMPSKPQGRFTRSGYISGRSKVRKKAVVTLKEGEIDFFEEI